MPRVTSLSKCLEKALSLPGQIQWEGVQDMVRVLNQGQSSSQDAAKMLKQYLRTNSPVVALKALIIVNSLVVNCGGDFQEKLLSNKWPDRIYRLAQHHTDKRVRQAALQLISNYTHTHKHVEFGVVFKELAESLSMVGLSLPSPTTMDIVDKEHSHVDEKLLEREFQRGLDFLQLQLPESSNSAGNCSLDLSCYSEELLHTVQKINVDVDKLQDAMKECNRVSRRYKNHEDRRKDVLEQLNIAWVVAEKCNVWAENMQAFLILDLREEELAEFLAANDRLNSTLRSWESLVSMDIFNRTTSDSETEESPALGLQLHSDASTASEGNEGVQLVPSSDMASRLRAENESLKLTLSNSQSNNRTALFAAEARFREEMKEVKSKAAWRIKDLMSQVADYELHKTRLRREREDLQFKLKSADQALQERSRKSANLEANNPVTSSAGNPLKQDLVRVFLEQEELESRLEEQRALAEDLKAEIHNTNAELEAQRADAFAEEARLTEEMEEFSRQVESMSRKLEDDEKNRSQIEASEQVISTLRLEVKRESILRKEAYNHIRELKGNIRVIARLRPSMKDTQQHDISVKLHDEYTIDLTVDVSNTSSSQGAAREVSRRYEFDACFGTQASQEEVYAETNQLLQSALDGHNVCIFCYGQTGSGKTHTLTSSGKTEGIIPRFVRDLFNSDTDSEKTSISAYVLELYQDDLIDVLDTSIPQGKLNIGADSESGFVTVKGVTICRAQSSAELSGIFEEGLKRRKTATTRCNMESSRSHLIFTVLLERLNVITGATTRSKISFVDLAGSERTIKSGAVNDKERLNEAKAINKSLSALGDVISALTMKESFIPYRNHKLTELMRDSLGGNAKTLMIVNISPLKSDAKETLNTLDYAQRVKQVTNKTSRSFETREIAQLRALIDRQNKEIQLLKTLSHSPST